MRMNGSGWRRVTDTSGLYCTAFVCLLACCDIRSYGCDDVEVKGARYQTSREGTYKESSLTCNGRPVYRQESRYAPNYMFYLNELTGWQGWMIGTTSCMNRGGMAAQSTAQHPADVGTYWEEVVGLYWETNRDLRVDCKKAGLSTAAVIGIILALVILTACVVGLLCYCCKYINKKNNSVNSTRQCTRGQPRPQVRRQQVATVNSTTWYYTPQDGATQYGGGFVPPPEGGMYEPPPYQPVSSPPPAYETLPPRAPKGQRGGSQSGEGSHQSGGESHQGAGGSHQSGGGNHQSVEGIHQSGGGNHQSGGGSHQIGGAPPYSTAAPPYSPPEMPYPSSPPPPFPGDSYPGTHGEQRVSTISYPPPPPTAAPRPSSTQLVSHQ